MSWFNEHKKVWRVAVLVLLLVAIAGPWTFELIWVPSEPPFSPCSAPYIRLDENFCGMPMSGKWLLGWMSSGFVSGTSELVTGANDWSEWMREVLVGLSPFLLALPFLVSLLLILRRDCRYCQVFNIAAWGLAVGIGLLIGLSSYPRQFWVLWGVWLYVGLASCALILEVLTLTVGRRLSPG